MVSEEEEEIMEEAEEEAERDESKKEQEEEEERIAAAYGYPLEKERPSAFAFFNKVLEKPDSSKVSNLTTDELGGTRLSVRDYQSMALFSAFLGHDKVARYFAGKSEITLATGLSKKGFLMNLVVTQKKERTKPSREVKKGWLSKE